jgi:hypothetical protein
VVTTLAAVWDMIAAHVPEADVADVVIRPVELPARLVSYGAPTGPAAPDGGLPALTGEFEMARPCLRCGRGIASVSS